MESPSIKDLENKYRTLWRRPFTTKAKAHLTRIRKIAIHLPNQQAVDTHQTSLYASRGAVDGEAKNKLHNWPALRRYLDDYLAKSTSEYAARSAKMSGVRRKRASPVAGVGGAGSGSMGNASGGSGGSGSDSTIRHL